MADLAHLYGSDLSVGPTGDLAIVTRAEQVRQRLYRRMLTTAGDYIWQLQFGAGLPKFIGKPTSADAIAAVVRAQMDLEADVVHSPEPIISVRDLHNNNVIVTIRYADAQTGLVQTLVVPVTA